MAKEAGFTRRLKRHVLSQEFEYLAVAQEGLRQICLAECLSLPPLPGPPEASGTSTGLPGARVADGGVAFHGRLIEAYRANLHLATASRVYLRLAEFRAGATEELFRKVHAIPWELWISGEIPLDVRAILRGAHIHHEGAAEAAVRDAVHRRIGATGARESDGGIQRILLHVEGHRCRLSLDTTGPRLNLRGYRVFPGPAPIREDLAAAVVRAALGLGRSETDGPPSGPLEAAPASGPPGGGPQPGALRTQPGAPRTPPPAGTAIGPKLIVDPMCGSGTIIIEAARLLAGIAPGAERSFLFEDWPSFQERSWAHVRSSDESSRYTSAEPPRLVGLDADEGTLRGAMENARRAGVGELVEFRAEAVNLDHVGSAGGSGPSRAADGAAEPDVLVITNPPYGLRLGRGGAESGGSAGATGRDGRGGGNAAADYVGALAARYPGARLALVLAERDLAKLPPSLKRPASAKSEVLLRFRHGGLRACLVSWA